MRTKHWCLLLWGGLLLFIGRVDGQVCYDATIWTSSRDDNIVRVVDLDTLEVTETFTIDVQAGNPVMGVPGIAFNPASETFYLLVQLTSPPGSAPFLFEWDPLNGTFDSIGNTVVAFDCLALNSGGFPHALSRGSASPPRAFCELSLLTGAPTDLCAISNTDDGQTIAYHPASDSFYQASGDQIANFVEVEAFSGPGAPCGVNSIALPTELSSDSVGAICWSVPNDAFLWKQGGVGGALYSVTPTGTATLLGTLDHAPTDMTVRAEEIVCVGGQFRRGDGNVDGTFDISDAVFLLGQLFIPGSPASTCQDANDSNDDGVVDISDAVFTLGALFIPGSPAPAAPGPDACGDDPTADATECDDYSFCP